MTSTYKVTYYKPGVGGSRSMNVQAEYHSEAEDLVRGMVPGADIINSQEVRNGASSSSMDFGDWGSAAILGALLAIGVVIAYWYIVLPVALIIGIIWYFINNN